MTDLLMIGLGVDTRRLRDGERALGRLQQVGNRTEAALGRMAATLVGAFAVDKITDYADSYTNLENRLKLVTNSEIELKQAIENVSNIAASSRQELGATGDLYFKISQNADKLNLSVSDVARVTETFGKTLALSGASTQGAEAAILQFSQALASGVIRGDEFNSVAENAPAAMDAFSRALGVSKGELRELAAEGKLTTDILIQALKEQAQTVDESFNKTRSTISQGFVDLKNNATLFIGELDHAIGSSTSFIDVLSSVSQSIKSVDVDKNVHLIGEAFDYAYKAGQIFVGLKVTGFVASMALSAQATVKNIVAQEALRNETIALANANVAATGIAARRAEAEAALTMQELAKARAISATTLATYNALVADAERARLDAVLAAGTAHAAAAELQRTVALDRVALAQEQVTITANAEAAAVARATAAAGANTAATVAQTEAQLALEAATRRTTGVLAGLGGPLNAVITLLGVAATAWFVFGDNAEKASDKSKEAIDKIRNNLDVTDDDARSLAKALNDVNKNIESTLENVRSANMGSNERLKVNLENELQGLYKQKKDIEEAIDRFEFNRTVDQLIANPDVQQGAAKEMLAAKEKQIKAEKEAKKAKEEEARAAEQLKNRYNDLILSKKEQIDLWGDDTELAKLNFDLQNTELSKLLPKQKELLRIQASKIDALKAEEEAKTQQKEVDNFMAQQAQELDALRQSFATKNEIARQGMLARKAILDKGYANNRMAEQEYIEKSLQNEMLYNAEKLAIQRDTTAEQTAIKQTELGMMSDLGGSILELARKTGHENNAIAQAAFVAQKVVAIAQAALMVEQTAIATQASYAMAAALTANPALLAAGTAHAAIIRGIGYANVAIMGAIAAVDIAQNINGARAMGGDVQAGNSYLVGERGPEVITMGGNGHVTPNHKLGGDTKVTIVNQTTGKIDKVEERRMPDGELILTILETVAAQTLDPNSKISRNQAAAFGLQRRR